MKRDVATTLTTRVFLIAASFAASIATARYLGPEGRGEYFFIVTLTAVMVQIGNLGLPSSNTYYVARDAALLGPLFANSAWISLGAGSVGSLAVVAVLAATGAFPDVSTGRLLLAALLVPPTLFYLLGTNLLVGVRRIGTFNFFEAASRIVVLAALVIAGELALGVGPFVAASIAAWSAVGAVVAIVLWRLGGRTLRPRLDLMRLGLRYASKAYVVTLLGYLVVRVNVFAVQAYAGERELGYFSIASQITDVLALLPASISLVLLPALVRSPERSFAMTVRAAAALGAILGTAALLTGLLAGPVIDVAFGESFEPATEILWWMLPGVVALGIAGVLSQYLAALGIPAALLGVWAAGVLVVVVVGLILVPEHGARGAGAAYSLASVCMLAGISTLAFSHRNAG
jgi:enterobacterial common antigen flippase